MTKPKQISVGLIAALSLLAGCVYVYVARPWAPDVDETEQPVWLLRAFVPAAEDYLATLDREQLLREFVIAPAAGFGGVVVTAGESVGGPGGAVPPLRVLRAVELDRASGGGWDAERPQSAFLASALASGDADAIALEAALHASRIVKAGAPVVFDSPLSWSTDLDGELLDLDQDRLRRLIRWIDPRRRQRKPLARAANAPGTLAESFANTAATGGVHVARTDTASVLGTVQLLDRLPRELSDSVFQISRSVGSWAYAEAILASDPVGAVDSLRAVPELTEGLLRERLVPLVVFRLATALMGTQRLSDDVGGGKSGRVRASTVKVARGQVRLSPELAEELTGSEVEDTMRYRALVRRRSIYLLNPAATPLPLATQRDSLVVLNCSTLDSTAISQVLGVYNPHVIARGATALEEPQRFDGSARVMIVVGPQASLDTVAMIGRSLLERAGAIVSVAVGHPYRLAVLPTTGPIFSMPVADDADWRNLLAAPFGGVAVTGRVPLAVGISAVGEGVMLPQTRPAPLDLLTAGIDVVALSDIDAIVRTAIRGDATPGAQVSVVYKGQLVYDRGFGVLAPGEREVDPTDLYDLASLTKVTATTIAAMKLYEEGRIKLDEPIRAYVKGLSRATGRLEVRDLLRHETGLRRDIPIQGQIRQNAKHYYGTDCRWKYCSKRRGRFTVPVAARMFFSRNDQGAVYAAAKAAVPNQRKRYGDLNFFLLQQVVESAAGVPIDRYVDSVFYEPMGLEMGYQPLAKFGPGIAPRVAPTEYDVKWRRQRLRGYVHDEAAALQGGVAGHAGNFGSARTVAILFDMLARGGVYGERRYLEAATVETFTDSKPGETRALGFVKAPRPDEPKKGVLPVFGHTGFTGTSVWTDPEKELTIAFTSNRIYRGRSNWKLQKTKVREQVQRVVYQALPE